MAVTGDTQLVATKNDLILEIVQRELQEKAKVIASGCMTDLSSRVGKGMRSIEVPKATSFTPQDRASAAAGTNQDIDFSTDVLNLDKRKHVQWLIDTNDEIESTVQVEIENAKRAVSGLARQFDVDSFAVMEAVSSHVAQAVAGDVSRDDVLGMREELLFQNAMEADICYWAAVDQYHNLLKVPEFTEVRLYGDQIIKGGQIGTLYGHPVFMSNLVPAGQIYALEKSGIGYAFQRRPSMDERRAPEYGSGAKVKVMDTKYGIAGMQLGVDSGNGTDAVGAAESPLVVKLQ
jgi:hypothetical protein